MINLNYEYITLGGALVVGLTGLTRILPMFAFQIRHVYSLVLFWKLE